MRVVFLRRRLFLLAVASILPLAALSSVGLFLLSREQQVQTEHAGLEITRALATAVDGELRRSIAALETLAAAGQPDARDLEPFRQRVLRTLAVRPFWSAFILADAEGRTLVDTRGADVAEPQTVDVSKFDAAVRTGKAAVGDLTKDPDGAYRIPISVPVIHDGRVALVAVALVKPDAVLEVVRRQRLPSDWVISVFDSSGMRVARSRRHLASLGGPASPSLAQLMSDGRSQGTGVTEALEGDRIVTAFSRLEGFGWSVAIGIPTAVVEAGQRRSIQMLGAGVLLSILIGFLAALLIGRRITGPIAELSAAARALGAGKPVVPPRTPIEELRHVADSLVAAEAERASGEAERERLLAREREARAAAESASRAKDEFLAMLGHELRNPLGAIANASRLLDHPGVDEPSMKRAREVIRRQISHLTRLMDDLLDAARAILGKIGLRREPVDLAALVARAIATLRAANRLEGHRLIQTLDPAWVEADATRLEQITTNLVVNAARYTPSGGAIRVSVGQEDGVAVLRVADEGIGMTPELQTRVFDLFFQGDRALDRAHGGLGLGLTLVRRLAELHGGTVSATSEGPGKGSEFTVRLPAIPRPATAGTESAGTEPSAARDVLIVEDNDDAREMLQFLLEVAGHRVRSESDGAAGLATALSSRPDVVLVDVGLPTMDGYEVARRIRAAHDGAWRPFLVALTGYGSAEDRKIALAAGFDEHVVKPADESVLLGLVAEARPS